MSIITIIVIIARALDCSNRKQYRPTLHTCIAVCYDKKPNIHITTFENYKRSRDLSKKTLKQKMMMVLATA